MSSSRGLLIAWFLVMTACGGQAVDGSGDEEAFGSGGNPSDASAGMQTAETGGTSSGVGGGGGATGSNSGAGGGATGSSGGVGGGGGATGSSSEHRDAASARAARFVNDYDVDCKEWQAVSLDPGQSSVYPRRVLQDRGRPGPYGECAQIADADARLACMMGLGCDFEWWNDLDWSQWHPGATVIEILGPRPEQINVAHSHLDSSPLPDGALLRFNSFYEDPPEESVPPGCHSHCGHYWYLDPTSEGVALVLSPPLAGDFYGGWSDFHLDVCLVE